MIDGTDLISLETVVRGHINEPVATKWTQANVFSAINAEHKRLCRKVFGLDSGYMEQILTTAAAATIALPVNCYKVRNVELYIDGAWRQPRHINDHARGQYQLSGTTYPSAWQFYNGSVVFENGIGSASSARIKYARMPSDMLYATLESGSGATAAVLPTGSPVDDAYNDDQFVVLDGEGAGQVSTVTDYVASTKTLTIASGAALDTTSVISFVLPDPLAMWGDLVAAGAALRLLTRNRDDNRSQMLRGDYERDLADMMEQLDSRQTEQSQRGNYLPTGDEE